MILLMTIGQSSEIYIQLSLFIVLIAWLKQIHPRLQWGTWPLLLGESGSRLERSFQGRQPQSGLEKN